MSNYIYTNDDLINVDELAHYGVKGMKWGIRRYQNSDGSLTADGKKRARQEYREDNKKAYDTGRTATISGHATAKSMGRTIRIENRLDKQYEKDPYESKNRTKNLRKKWDASAKTTKEFLEKYVADKDKAEKHCKELIDKYGDEAVSKIKYSDVKLPKGKYSPDSFKTMNEKTNNAMDYATAVGTTLTSMTVSRLINVPFYIVAYPTSTKQKAATAEYNAYRQNRKNG